MILGVIKYITPTGGNTLISLRFFKGYAIIQLHSFSLTISLNIAPSDKRA